jgi:hypothetical protein
MFPQYTHVFAENSVITQAPIGTPILLRSNPSLSPGYNALNTSISNSTQNPSGGSNIFVPPRYLLVVLFLDLPRLSLGDLKFLLHLHLEDLIVPTLVDPVEITKTTERGG